MPASTVSLERVDAVGRGPARGLDGGRGPLSGRRILVARAVDAPREAVWDVLVDTHRWPEWGPSVTAVEATDREIREGTTGRVRAPGGFWLPFAVTTCADYRWTWRVAGVPATGHRVDPLGDDRCRACFEVALLAAGYVPVCQRALARIADVVEEPRGGRSGAE